MTMLKEIDAARSKERPHGSPRLSVVVPFRDEGESLLRCLRSLLDQDLDPEAYEVILVNGNPDDSPASGIELLRQRSETRIESIENPRANTPSGLNLGVARAEGDAFLIFGAHSEAERSFLRSTLEELQKTNADCVGGALESVGDGYLGDAIAAVLSSPFGVGNSKFRTSSCEGYVDTVAYGAYRHEVFDTIGAFDERLFRNQDIEFNYRLRKAGGKIWMSPKIKSYYHVPATFGGFVRQAFSNGFWNVRTWKLVPGSLALRHFVPLAFVMALLGGVALAPLVDFGAQLLAIILLSYISVAIISSVVTARRRGLTLFPVLPGLFFAIHVAYGLGSLWGLLRLVF